MSVSEMRALGIGPASFDGGDLVFVQDADLAVNYRKLGDYGYACRKYEPQKPTIPTNCKNCGAPLKGDCEYCETRYL